MLSADLDAVRRFLALAVRNCEQNDYKAWLVGGCVRDYLLGRESTGDIDVVVEGDALRVAKRFADLVLSKPPILFERFGTAHLSWNGLEIEFAQARSESYSDQSRKPEVKPASIREDVRRRDFTCNALLIDLDGNVVDLVDGLPDLRAGILRTPDLPLRTFQDDPLRMFRLARFVSQLDFTLAGVGMLGAMRLSAELARPPKVSVERITEELRKLLVGKRPSTGLRILQKGSLLRVVLPELEQTVGVKQNEHHLWDVWEHTLRVVEGTEPDLILRLAALFHDIGKPLTADGQGHFYDHQKVGAELTKRRMEELRFSSAEIQQTVQLVRLHMHPMRYRSDWGNGAIRRLALSAGDLLPILLKLAQADASASAKPDRKELVELEARLSQVRTEQPTRFKLLIDGEDVKRVLGIPSGPKVGNMLKQAQELVLDEHLSPERESLLEWLKEQKDG